MYVRARITNKSDRRARGQHPGALAFGARSIDKSRIVNKRIARDRNLVLDACCVGEKARLRVFVYLECGIVMANEGENVGIIARFIDSAEAWVQEVSESDAMCTVVSYIHYALSSVGVQEHNHPDPISVCRSFIATGVTLLVYYLIWGKRHVTKRRRLAQELHLAEAKLKYLQEKLTLVQIVQKEEKEETRIFMDGAFDLLHYGHMNAFRLGRSLGTHLVVGVNSDESISACKGVPLMNDQERLTMVQACKFVDEVVPGCPYIMNREYLDYVIDKYNIDYVIHGDDPCIVDGKDVYAAAKKAGKFRSIPRTEGVSTTDIVGRMLLMTKEHHYHDRNKEQRYDNGQGSNWESEEESEDHEYSELQLLGRQSKFLTTSRMLRLFSAGTKSPTEDMRVIYIDGAWDMFHCGHVAILKAAKEKGDYLIVGIHSDAVVNQHRGSNLPLMNLHERVLSVLSCRFVDDVLIDAPYEITPEMVASLNIAEVVHGTNSDDIGILSHNGEERYAARYKYPREIGIFTMIESPSNFKLGSIIKRIQKNQETFQAKFERKIKAENEFYKGKYNKNKVL